MDDFGIWLIIVAALAVVVGPVFVLLPSKKERRLAALRTEARRLGLSVELRPVPNLGADLEERVSAGGRARTPMHPSVRYALPLALEIDRRPEKSPDRSPSVGATQAEQTTPATSSVSTIGPYSPSAKTSAGQTTTVASSAPVSDAADNWRLLRGPAGWVADAEAPPPTELAAQLLPLLDQLPDDAVALDRLGRSLGCCWLESFPAQADSVADLKTALTAIAKAVAAWETQGRSRPQTP